MAGVFISYSRVDRPFVEKLYGALETGHREPWVDWSDIPPTANFLQEIFAAIEAADAFVFVMSPDSLSSRMCRIEVSHAAQFHKRVIPVLYRPVASSEVMPEIAHLNWIYFRESDDFDAAMKQLEFALDTNLHYWHLSSQLLVRARQWERESRDPSATLRGRQLDEAEHWLTEGSGINPAPSQLQVDFIAASRRVVKRRRRTIVAALTTATCVILLLSFASLYLFRNAGIQQQGANQAHIAGLARQLDLNAATLLDQGQPDLALLLSAEASRLQSNLDTRDTLLNVLVDSPHLRSMYYGKPGVGFSDVAISPDGQVLYAAADSVYRWSLSPTGSHSTPTLTSADLGASQVVPSPDGKLIAANLGGGGILLLDATTGQVEQHLGGTSSGSGGTSDLAFNSDGTNLILVNGARIQQWDVRSGDLLGTALVGSSVPNEPSALSADGALLALAGCADSSCATRQVQIWDVLHRKLDAMLPLGVLGVTALTFSPDDSKLAVGVCTVARETDTYGCNSGLIEVWSIASERLLDSAPVVNELGQVNSLAFSPDSTYLVSGLVLGDCSGANCNQGQLELWSVGGLHRVGEPFAGHLRRVERIVFTRDGEYFATVGGDNRVYIWHIGGYDDVSHFLILPNFQGSTPDSQLVYTSSGNELLSRNGPETNTWDPFTGGLLDTLHLRSEGDPANPFHYAVLSADGRTMAECDGDILLWNVSAKAILRRLSNPHPGQDCMGMAFSRDGKSLALLESEQITVWDTETGGITQHIDAVGAQSGINDVVANVAFSADDSMIASNAKNGLTFWNVATGELIGTLISATASDKTMQAVSGLFVFSPDRNTLALETSDGSISTWNVHTRRIITRLGSALSPQTQAGSVALAISQNARFLVSTGYYNVTVWDLSSRTPFVHFPHPGPISRVAAFSPDSRYLTWDDNDGIIIIRSLDLGTWQSQACAIVGRNLTPAEWKQYVNGISYTKVCPGVTS